MGKGKGKGKREGKAWGGVAAGKEKSNLGFWEWKGEGEREGKAWGGVEAGKGKRNLGFWEGKVKKGKIEGGGGVGGWKLRGKVV